LNCKPIAVLSINMSTFFRTRHFDKTLGELPFRLHVRRIDKVDQNSVDEYVIYLWKLANDCNGDYDGWETSIEKD